MIRTFFLNFSYMITRVSVRLACLLALCCAVVMPFYGQTPEEKINTTEGTRFLIIFPRITATKFADPTLQLYVMATANEAVEIEVRIKNRYLDVIRIPAGGGSGVVKINPAYNNLCYVFDDDQVYPRGIAAFSRDGKTPFSCYAFIQAGQLGASARDFALAIPQKALGREYLIQTFPTDGESSEFAIMATEDNTTVRITPSAPTSTGQTAGTPFVRKLARMESVLIASKKKVKDSSDTLDLSGSLICADKPVAVFAANEATNIPFHDAYSTDYTFEQIPPLNTFGRRFFVARLDKYVQNMECCVTALYDNTEVKETRYNVKTGTTATITHNLRAFQSLAERPVLNEIFSNIVIETSQPVLCHTYLTSAAYNRESIYDDNGRLIADNTWGDPANAMLVPWDHRVKDMNFFTDELQTKENAVQYHYVHVNVPKNEIGLLKLDGAAVDNSLFKTYGGDAGMAYAAIPVEKVGRHRLTTTGEGFTGYVYGISADGTGYMYTLGYRLDMLTDSLYITDQKNYMSPKSYDLDLMKNGWYQRQFDDFPPDQPRYDTAIVCDKTTLNFAIDCDHTYDSVFWQVDKMTKQGKLERVIIREDFKFAKLSKWQHLFEQDADKDKEASKRDPYTNYQVHAILRQPRIICPGDMPIYDTLTTVVRVMRFYDDTIPRVICENESIEFFSDKSHFETINKPDIPKTSELGARSERKPTVFIGDASVKGEEKVDDFTYKIGRGKHFFKRKYETASGCDSIVTFAVYVCSVPSQTTLKDMVLTHDKPVLEFNGGDNTFYNGRTIDKPGVYKDVLRTVGCNCGGLEDPKFQGCDSTVILKVHLRDTLRTHFCDRTEDPALYEVDPKDFDFVWTGHPNPDVAGQVALGETKTFEDNHKSIDNLDSSYVLILTHEPVTVITYPEITLPNGFAYTWEYSDGDITRTKDIPAGNNETRTVYAHISYENGNCPMLFRLTLTWKEMDAKMEPRSVCLNDTIHHRGKIYAGADWQDTYPNASFTPDETRGVGYFQIEAETVDEGTSTITYWIGLTVKPTYETDNTRYLCDNEVIEHNGEYIAGSKAVTSLPIAKWLTDKETTYDQPLETVLGCDSIVHTVFYMSESFREVLYDTICNIEDYVWEGHSNSGRPIYNTETGGMINFGHGQLWNDDSPRHTFVLTDSLRTTDCPECPRGSCDSVYVLSLTVLPSYSHEFNIDMSEEDVEECGDVTYGGIKAKRPYDFLITQDTTIECSFPRQVGTHVCDSFVIKHIRLGQVKRDTTFVFLEGGEEYIWRRTLEDGTVKTVCSQRAVGGETVYCYDRYTTALGFDSVFVLALYGAPNYDYEETDSVCQTDGTYDWTGHMGSDHNLRINGLAVREISLRDSGWVTIQDRLKSIKNYYDPHGGPPTTTYTDSIHTLRLYVRPVFNEMFNKEVVVSRDTICSNDKYVWERTLYVGTDYDETAFPIDDPSPYYDDIVRLSSGNLDADGFYNALIPLKTVLGCDSVLSLHLKFNTIVQTHLTPSIGDNDPTWTFGHGSNRHTGDEYLVSDYTDDTRDKREYHYVDTMQTVTGCDSIIFCDLTVLPTYLFWDPEDKTCTTDKYDWRAEYTDKFLDINLVRQEYFYDTLESVRFGADSIRALHLIHIPGLLETAEKQLCKDAELLWHGQIIKFTPANTGDVSVLYEQRYKGLEGCDSVYQVRVQYFDLYSFPVEEDQVCRFQAYHWYDEDGNEHTKGLRDESGKKLKSIPTDTVGWITIYDSLSTVTCKCDSVYTLRLFVNDAAFERDSDRICSDASYTWSKNGKTYTFDDERHTFYPDTIVRDTFVVQNAAGCNDSSLLYLKVDRAFHFVEDTVVVCGFELPYTSWTGHDDHIDLKPSDAEKWDHDSIFNLWDHKVTILGCDSDYHLPVRVMPEQKTFLFDTICQGDTLYWRDHVLTRTDVIRDEDKNIFGCDSSITMDLLVIPPTKFAVVDIPAVCADATTFDVHYSSDGEPAIAYCVRYNDWARQQNFVDVEWTAVSREERTLTLPMPVHEDKMHYTLPSDYEATIYFDNGYCLDSNLLVLPLKFQVRYPSWLMEQHWNDAIGLLVDSLNGGYHFYAFQWYKNDVLMPGETKPYLYCPQYLKEDALYSVALSRASDSLTYFTCYLKPDLSQQQTLSPSLPYISVVPTHVVVENPVVNILCVNSGTFEIYDPYGAKLTSGVYHPGAHNAHEIQLPAVPGVYIFHLHDESSLERTVKVLVQ